MKSIISVNEINQYLPVLTFLNDRVRFVNPVRNLVFELTENGFIESGGYCFEYLSKKMPCENCISVHAFQQKCSVMKIVNDSNSVLMVTAIPVINAGEPLVIELFNDITASLVFESERSTTVRKKLDTIFTLRDQVITDQLTSIYNRRFVDERLPLDIQNTRIEGYPITVLFIDIDDFKNINDKYGHDVGDVTLKEAANIFREAIRMEIDWVARYGGDEFLICLNHADENTSRIIAERISMNIKKVLIPVDGGNIHFTVSIGAHTMRKKIYSAEEIIMMADKNMYTSKSKGKDRITISAV